MTGRDAWDAMALVGQIARPHGLRGDVFVNSETDFPEERFREGAVLSMWQDGRIHDVTVDTVRLQQGRPVLHLHGVDSIDAAQALAGAELRVPGAALTAWAPGPVNRHELGGCRVETVSGAVVGDVDRVEADVGNDRLVVRGSRGDELIPMAAAI
jgi:16S rRNA processing protein RimM